MFPKSIAKQIAGIAQMGVGLCHFVIKGDSLRNVQPFEGGQRGLETAS
jgi:hypothetical protein